MQEPIRVESHHCSRKGARTSTPSDKTENQYPRGHARQRKQNNNHQQARSINSKPAPYADISYPLSTASIRRTEDPFFGRQAMAKKYDYYSTQPFTAGTNITLTSTPTFVVPDNGVRSHSQWQTRGPKIGLFLNDLPKSSGKTPARRQTPLNCRHSSRDAVPKQDQL